MFKLILDLKPSQFANSKVRISNAENNAFRRSSSGTIELNVSNTDGNARNTPGNGIDGTLGQPIPIIRMNSTVSRKVSLDPTPANEGINLPNFITAYLAYLNT